MLCPIDQTTLVMTERQGVEIDYCPTCRGVWLDRGELDKVIDRASTESASPDRYRDDDDRYDDVRSDRSDRRSYRPQEDQGGVLGKVSQALGQQRGDDQQTRYDQQGRPRRKKKESFLDDLFDF